MNHYHNLQIYSYEHPGQNIQEEYHKRFDGYGTIKFPLYINPMFHGMPTSDQYQLFFVPIESYNSLITSIRNNSMHITKIINNLPGVASNQFFLEMLTKEIKGTNDIEGVYSTTEEINVAIDSAQNNNKRSTHTRFHSFASMYLKIKNQEVEKIKKLKDIRDIYDFLLKGEIPQSKYPDGELFRNDFVRIGSSTQTVHQPKTDEKLIMADLEKWIEFINEDKFDPILKACVAHYYFEYIHPFYDGNGRVGRYIFCSYLGNKLDPYTAISFSHQVNLKKEKYYHAFEEIENQKNYGEITFFVSNLLKYLAAGQKKVIANLELSNKLLKYIDNQLKHCDYSNDEIHLLYIYSQSFLFNNIDQGIDDNFIQNHRSEIMGKKMSVRKIRNLLDSLENRKILVTVKKSPLKRVLTDKFFKSIDMDIS
ncbi:MAG: Fic family protein [Lactobacillus sp.]|nr:Fic family protein [Lactobacillus sp.]